MGYLYQRQTRWATHFSLFTPFFVALFIRYGVAVPFSNDANPNITHVPISTGQLVEYYISLVITYLGLYVGIILAGTLGLRFASPWPAPREVMPGPLIAVAAFVLGVVVLVWIAIPWDDFYSAFTKILGSSHTAGEYREHRVLYGDLTHYSRSVVTYLGSFARFALAPTVLWVLFFHRRNRAVFAIFAVMFSVLMLIGLASGQKQPEVLLFVGFIFAWLVRHGIRVNSNWTIGSAIAALMLVIIPILYHVQYPQASYPQLIQETVNRLTVEYSRAAQLRFIFYPHLHPYLLGAGSFGVSTLGRFVGLHIPAAELAETYIPSHVANVGPGYGGTWNAGFFAEAWADFGWPGVVLSAFIVGVLLSLLVRWYDTGPRGPLQMGVYTAASVSTLFLTDVSLTTALWTYGLVSGFMVYWILRPFGREPSDGPDEGPETLQSATVNPGLSSGTSPSS